MAIDPNQATRDIFYSGLRQQGAAPMPRIPELDGRMYTGGSKYFNELTGRYEYPGQQPAVTVLPQIPYSIQDESILSPDQQNAVWATYSPEEKMRVIQSRQPQPLNIVNQPIPVQGVAMKQGGRLERPNPKGKSWMGNFQAVDDKGKGIFTKDGLSVFRNSRDQLYTIDKKGIATLFPNQSTETVNVVTPPIQVPTGTFPVPTPTVITPPTQAVETGAATSQGGVINTGMVKDIGDQLPFLLPSYYTPGYRAPKQLGEGFMAVPYGLAEIIKAIANSQAQ